MGGMTINISSTTPNTQQTCRGKESNTQNRQTNNPSPGLNISLASLGTTGSQNQTASEPIGRAGERTGKGTINNINVQNGGHLTLNTNPAPYA